MKTNNVTFTCDVCGCNMPHPAFVKNQESAGFEYWVNIRRRDMSLVNGTYRPPFRKCHICAPCLAKIAQLFTRDTK